MDGTTRADYSAIDGERDGPLPAGMDAVHVAVPHRAVVLREADRRNSRRVFILANASLGEPAAALQAELLAAAPGRTCTVCTAVKMGGGDGGILVAADAAADCGADCVVTLGGGAVQDAGKIIRLWLWAYGARSGPATASGLQAALGRLLAAAVLPPQIACPSVFAMAELTGMAGMVSGRASHWRALPVSAIPQILQSTLGTSLLF